MPLLLPLHLLFLVLFASSALALEPCLVGARLIEASNTTQESNEVHAFLKEISHQLNALPFSNYRSLDYKEQSTTFQEKAEILLEGEAETNRVEVTPHEVSMGKVNVTLNWQDDSGKKIVSSRFKLNNGENLVVGLERELNAKQRSSILSVKVYCR